MVPVRASDTDIPTLVWLSGVTALPHPAKWSLFLRVCAATCSPLSSSCLPEIRSILEAVALARPTELESLLQKDLALANHRTGGGTGIVEPPFPPRAAALVELVRLGLNPTASSSEQRGTCLGIVSTVVLGWFAGAVELSGAAALQPEYESPASPLAAVPAVLASRTQFWRAHSELRATCAEFESYLQADPQALAAHDRVCEGVLAMLNESFQ